MPHYQPKPAPHSDRRVKMGGHSVDLIRGFCSTCGASVQQVERGVACRPGPAARLGAVLDRLRRRRARESLPWT